MRDARWLLIALLALVASPVAADEDAGLRVQLGRATMSRVAPGEPDTPSRLSLSLGSPAHSGRPEIRFVDGNRLSVYVFGSDRSVIVDLGEMRLGEVASLPVLPAWSPYLTTTAPVHKGHVYLVRTLGDGLDHASLLRVEEFAPGATVTVAWIVVGKRGPGEGRPPQLEEEAQSRLQGLLAGVLREERRTFEDPRILPQEGTYRLQLRTGDQKGLVSYVALHGRGTGIDHWSDTPLDMSTPPRPSDEARAHATRGGIPAGRVLVIEAAEILASSTGDANGRGGVAVRVGAQEIHREVGEKGPHRSRWVGRVILRPQQSHLVAVSAASTSRVDLRLEGRLLPEALAKDLESKPLEPEGGDGEAVPRAQGKPIEGPRATLELRLETAAEAAAPREVDLLAVGYVPSGQTLHIEGIHFEGRGPFELRVGGRAVAREVDHREPIRGAAFGSWTVRRGTETEVRLRVLPGGAARIVLEGWLRRSHPRQLGPYRKDPK